MKPAQATADCYFSYSSFHIPGDVHAGERLLLTTLAALSAAALLAMATGLQHRSAALVAAGAGTAELTAFLVRTSRHPLWAKPKRTRAW